ncbi:MAG: prepilin-type N-terminal cleavage/methylation domain-containing protein [Betaproteobacteria bacterium]|nr:prepilin-type N-terminal cleavage/methylation domain-containing protein [Betaproteobacteria bacterium]
MMGTQRGRGFTLVELLVVMAIVALLVSLAAPHYFGGLEKSKETALRQTLAVTRDALDKFYGDNGRYPDSLEALVNKRYLRSLPVDPVTESSATWTVVAPEDPSKGGVYDIHSGAEGVGRDGKPFREL